MRDTFFLTFDKFGARRMNKSVPSLKAGEYAVHIQIEVPDRIFARDIPQVKVTIPEVFAITPPVTATIVAPPSVGVEDVRRNLDPDPPVNHEG